MAGKSVAKAVKANRKPQPLEPNSRMGEHIKELTAIHAHTDALALAVAEAGADAFRDDELSAILFDLEERLMHVRDGFKSLPRFAREEASHG